MFASFVGFLQGVVAVLCIAGVATLGYKGVSGEWWWKKVKW